MARKTTTTVTPNANPYQDQIDEVFDQIAGATAPTVQDGILYETDAEGNIALDENGNPIQLADFNPYMQGIQDTREGLTEQMEGLATPDPIQSMTDWMVAAGYNPADYQTQMQNLRGSIDQWTQNAGTLTEDNMGAADDYFARLAGFENGANLDSYMQQLQGDMSGGISGQQGLTGEERTAMDQVMRRNMEGFQDDMDRQLESIMGSGAGTMQALAVADQFRNQISDQRLAGELEIINQDFVRKQQNYENKKQEYFGLMQQGIIGRDQFMGWVRSDNESRLQGFSAQMQAVNQQYQSSIQGYGTYLQGRGIEAQVFESQINAMNNYANAQINLLNAEMNGIMQPYMMAAELYNLKLSPMVEKLATLLSVEVGSTSETTKKKGD
jgi:hypothetical protein